MELLIIWVMVGICSGFIASAKGRSGFAWGFMGMLFGVFALIAIACVPAKTAA